MYLRKALALLLTLLLTLVPLSSALAEGEDTDQPVFIGIDGNTSQDQRTQERDVGNITVTSGSYEAAARVDVRAPGEGTIRAEDISSSLKGHVEAYAIQVDAQGQGARATVEAGAVSAFSEQGATDVEINASGAGAEATVTVGSLTAVSKEGNSYAVYMVAQDGGVAQVQVTGQEGVQATNAWPTIYMVADSGNAQATVAVAGDIVAQGDSEPEGAFVSANEGAAAALTCGGDILAQGWEAKGIDMNCTSADGAEEVDATAAVTVAGSVTAQGENATGVEAFVWNLAAGTLTVGGDVTGTATGLVAEARGEGGTIDVLVGGTLSGGDQAILASGNSVNEGLTLTVWALEGNTLVKAEKGADAETIENGIQYIIKTQQPEAGGSFEVDGVTVYKDLNVAHAGDTVTVLPTLSEGYMLLGAYNNGAALLQNEAGSYYLVVPQGGGILLTVELGEYPPLNEPPQPPVRVTGTAATADGGASVVFCSNQVLHMMVGDENVRGYFYSYEARLCFRIGSEDAAYTEHEDGSGTLTAGGFTFELSPALVLALKVECYS